VNAEMAKIATLDPDWVKRERRRELRFWGSLVVAIIAIAGATYAVVVNKEQATQITRIEPKVTKLEQTPCAKDATSEACQKLRAEVEKAAGVVVTCIPFRRAGYPCPRPGSDLAEEQAQGGDAQQTGSTGHQQPSPSPSGGGGNGTGAGKDGQTGGHGGGHSEGHSEAPVTPEPQAQSEERPDISSDIPRDIPAPANEPADPEPHPLPETVEAAGGVVGETGEAVQGTVESAGKAADCVLRGGC
jgi:hypothetical protein